MKNKLAQVLMSVALAIGFAVFANAQTGATHRATIPFDFIVGEKTFKAGEYTVNFGVSSSVRDNFLLRSTDTKQSAIVSQTISKNTDKNLREATFVFYIANEHYYLAEVNTVQRSVALRSPQLKKMPKAKKYELALAR